jgi:hypothetical protein
MKDRDRKKYREAVIAEVARVMARADAEGKSKILAAREAFPGIPMAVVAEANAVLSRQAEADWWAGIEKTIDGEIVRRALTSAGGASE